MSPFMVHPNSELDESEYEEALLATFATNEESKTETTTPGGKAAPLEAVAADDDDSDDNETDLSVFTWAAQ